ncbi:MAG: hypothetical protein ACKVHE_20975 [Planctomycetales bacterium]|jgi:hypothetical protein
MSQSSSSQRKPEKVFRIGFVSASVFAHNIDTDDGTRTIRSVSIQKNDKDGDEVKYTSSFDLAEMPQALRVMQLAQAHVESEESEIHLTD